MTDHESTAPSSIDEPEPGAFGELLGLRHVVRETGRSVLEMDIGAGFHNPHGVAHGGAIASLADQAMGSAATFDLEPGEMMRTVEMKINYLRGVQHGVIRADARVQSRGRTVALITCDVRDAEDRPVAFATSTYMRVAPRD